MTPEERAAIIAPDRYLSRTFTEVDLEEIRQDIAETLIETRNSPLDEVVALIRSDFQDDIDPDVLIQKVLGLKHIDVDVDLTYLATVEARENEAGRIYFTGKQDGYATRLWAWVQSSDKFKLYICDPEGKCQGYPSPDLVIRTAAPPGPGLNLKFRKWPDG